METAKLTQLVAQLTERDAAHAKLRDELTATNQRTATEIESLNNVVVSLRRAEASMLETLAAERANLAAKDDELAKCARRVGADSHRGAVFARRDAKVSQVARPDDAAPHRAAQQYAVDIRPSRAESAPSYQQRVDEAACGSMPSTQLRHEQQHQQQQPHAFAKLTVVAACRSAPRRSEARALFAELDARQFAGRRCVRGSAAPSFFRSTRSSATASRRRCITFRSRCCTRATPTACWCCAIQTSGSTRRRRARSRLRVLLC
jgi:hypothetical protein